jgi:hypothetical protein
MLKRGIFRRPYREKPHHAGTKNELNLYSEENEKRGPERFF